MALDMKYFVLKPNGDDMYSLASRLAMRSYAYAIVEHDPELAKAMLEWANREMENARGGEICGKN